MLQFVEPLEHIWAVRPPEQRLCTGVQNNQEFAIANRSGRVQNAKNDKSEDQYLPGPEQRDRRNLDFLVRGHMRSLRVRCLLQRQAERRESLRGAPCARAQLPFVGPEISNMTGIRRGSSQLDAYHQAVTLLFTATIWDRRITAVSLIIRWTRSDEW